MVSPRVTYSSVSSCQGDPGVDNAGEAIAPRPILSGTTDPPDGAGRPMHALVNFSTSATKAETSPKTAPPPPSDVYPASGSPYPRIAHTIHTLLFVRDGRLSPPLFGAHISHPFDSRHCQLSPPLHAHFLLLVHARRHHVHRDSTIHSLQIVNVLPGRQKLQ